MPLQSVSAAGRATLNKESAVNLIEGKGATDNTYLPYAPRDLMYLISERRLETVPGERRESARRTMLKIPTHSLFFSR